MDEQELEYLDAFAGYLRTLASDVAEVAHVAPRSGNSEARATLLGSLNYLFRSIDLIPDGIDDLGFLDDAFVLRIASRRALIHDAKLGESNVGRFASEALLVDKFLGDLAYRFEHFLESKLAEHNVRGRTARALSEDSAASEEFVREVMAWTRTYTVPGFTRDPRNLIKLRSFLATRLPD